MNNVLHQQKGFTLVEFMIAVVLGLMLIAGVIQIFISTVVTSKMNIELKQVQENGRIALSVFEKAIQKAGWAEPSKETLAFYTLDNNLLFPGHFDADGKPVENATANNLEEDIEGNAFEFTQRSDRLVEQHQGVRDCVGNPVNSGKTGLVINRYFVAENDGVSELFCKGNGEGSDQAEPIVSYIDNVQLLYGVDVFGDDSSIQYFNASDIIKTDSAPSDAINRIAAVKVSILVRSDAAVSKKEQKSVQLLDENLDEKKYQDSRLRQIFNKTIYLPNRSYR